MRHHQNPPTRYMERISAGLEFSSSLVIEEEHLGMRIPRSYGYRAEISGRNNIENQVGRKSRGRARYRQRSAPVAFDAVFCGKRLVGCRYSRLPSFVDHSRQVRRAVTDHLSQYV